MYHALYRKYRPLDFNSVFGQNVIVETLKNAVINNHISHAYLFSGPRGTGKTTIAKIFARAVNCSDSVDGVACGKCQNCLYSFSKECMDIIEIDAASNNGVDEIRELRSKVGILPSELKYKVYIIDEVHMLSIGAFNALLKTIEEPPDHVIFVLATTDPQKIPQTIISRCQWYNFRKISDNDIVNRLREVVSAEKIDLDERVLEKIAIASDGALRDALGLLDKLRAYKSGYICLDDFYAVNGQISDEELNNLEKTIFSLNVGSVLNSFEKYYRDGKDLIQVLKQLMFNIKNELFDYYANNEGLLYDEKIMLDFLNLLNEKMISMKKADDVRLSIEITLLHYINSLVKDKNVVDTINFDKVRGDNVNDEKKVTSVRTVNVSKTNYNFESFKKCMLIRSKNIMIDAVKDELLKETSNFKLLEDYTFDSQFGYLACELMDGKVRASSHDAFIISYEYESMIEKISDHFLKLNEFYNMIVGSGKKISIITDEKWEELKKEYIMLLNEGNHFDYQEEPDLDIGIVENNTINDKDDSIDEFIELFGDIVEVK